MTVRGLWKTVLLVAGSALLIVAVCAAGLLTFIYQSSQLDQSWNIPLSAVSDALAEGPQGYVFTAGPLLDEQGQWAMLLDAQGRVIWQWNKPADVPDQFTLNQVASFSRWYLSDYPVQVRTRPDGLLVVGSPKGSTWKYSIAMDSDVLARVPAWLTALFLVSLLCVIGLSAWVLRRWFRKEQRQRDAARSDWIHGVSHDIRTPLSMVMGYASQLETDPALPEPDHSGSGQRPEPDHAAGLPDAAPAPGTPFPCGPGAPSGGRCPQWRPAGRFPPGGVPFAIPGGGIHECRWILAAPRPAKPAQQLCAPPSGGLCHHAGRCRPAKPMHPLGGKHRPGAACPFARCFARRRSSPRRRGCPWHRPALGAPNCRSPWRHAGSSPKPRFILLPAPASPGPVTSACRPTLFPPRMGQKNRECCCKHSRFFAAMVFQPALAVQIAVEEGDHLGPGTG